MIIFDLDGTLADCEHRQHFVKSPPMWEPNNVFDPLSFNVNSDNWRNFIPKWKEFYEACDNDKPILHVIEMFILISINFGDVRIWTGRCESVRKKTINWLFDNLELGVEDLQYIGDILKMRPIGDDTPIDQLKERWLDEVIDSGKTIDFVFEFDRDCVNMWKQRSIFVFDVNQTTKEF